MSEELLASASEIPAVPSQPRPDPPIRSVLSCFGHSAVSPPLSLLASSSSSSSSSSKNSVLSAARQAVMTAHPASPSGLPLISSSLNSKHININLDNDTAPGPAIKLCARFSLRNGICTGLVTVSLPLSLPVPFSPEFTSMFCPSLKA